MKLVGLNWSRSDGGKRYGDWGRVSWVAIVREARRLKPPAKLAGGEGANGWGELGLDLGGWCVGRRYPP